MPTSYLYILYFCLNLVVLSFCVFILVISYVSINEFVFHSWFICVLLNDVYIIETVLLLDSIDTSMV